MGSQLPAGTRRLFAHYDETVLDGSTSSLVLSKVLEYGDRRDLAWLMETVSERDLTDWLVARGCRHLSRRSRSFWRLLLLAECAEPFSAPEPELWPL